MSRSNPQPVQQTLTLEPPDTVTVNGTGLMEYGERARAGELHIYRMVCDGRRNGVYTLSLLRLDGRRLYGYKQFATTEMKRETPLASIGQSVESPKGLGRPDHEPLMQKPSAVKSASPKGNPDANTFKPRRDRPAAVQEALKLFR